MQVYQTDYTGDGRFVGVIVADPDPMNEGEWLIPAGAVSVAPPVIELPAYARWTGTEWEVFTPPVPEPEPELPPSPPSIPQVVSRFQARAALYGAGLLDDVENAIAAADPLVQMAWADAQEFQRNSPTILALAGVLGLSESDVDELFITASGIVA